MNIFLILIFSFSLIVAVITLLIFTKQKKFILNYKSALIFTFPFLFGVLLFITTNKKAPTNKKENKKEFIINSDLIINTEKKICDKSIFAKEVCSTYNFFEIIDTGFELKLNKNENFTKILKPYGVTDQEIYKLGEFLKENIKFNINRDLKPNKTYALFFNEEDSISKLNYFAYEINPEKYLYVKISKDTVYGEIHYRVPTIKRKEISGIINSSLWFALEDAGISTNLEIDAVMDQITERIYPWTINFYKLYPEDRFKLIYDAKYINNSFYEVDKVHASVFSHNGKDNYAIAFSELDSTSFEYYDQEGDNLRKFFLTAPVSYKRISSRYSNSRKHPVTGRIKAHKGTDFAAAPGSEIYATADGVIEKASYTSANGYYVKIKHNNTYSSGYLHMNKQSQSFWKKNNIKPGEKIKQKDIIGFVGSTGLATGPHVCYRFWQNGKQVDPFKCKLPPSEPISDKYLSEFNLQKIEWTRKLDSILYKDQIYNNELIEETSNHHYP